VTVTFVGADANGARQQMLSVRVVSFSMMMSVLLRLMRKHLQQASLPVDVV